MGKCVEVWGSVWRYLKLYGGELKWLEVCRGVGKFVEMWGRVWRCGEECGGKWRWMKYGEVCV